MIQWDLLKIGRCYIATEGPPGLRFSGIPFKIIAKSLPFLLVEWQDDGIVSTIDTRELGFSVVDKRYLTKFRQVRVCCDIQQPSNRCINCGTSMNQTFQKGEWQWLCPQCGSLGGPVNA
jgi:hypothetical protein